MNDNISRSSIFREEIKRKAQERKEESKNNPPVVRVRKPFYSNRGESLPKEENIEK